MRPDTIVIGAGAAGCVIAERISRAGREVLLLEAGPDYPDPDLLPEDLADGTRNSMRRHDWGLKRVLRGGPACLPFPRGRVVGGSSAVNTCIAVRGEAYDYDEWADRGLPEWSWAHVAPAFAAITQDVTDATSGYAPHRLPLHRPAPDELADWTRGFVGAARAMGYPETDDHNTEGSTGVGPHALNRLGGRRISAAEVWLTPDVRARPNLTVRAETAVERLVFSQRRLQGVIVRTPSGPETITASRVVLTAGAIFTPDLLIRSGIGPAETLERLGVPQVYPLPGVGARLLDHPGFALMLRPAKGVGERLAPVIQAAIRTTSTVDGRTNDLQIQPGNNFALRLHPALGVPLVSLMAHLGKPHGHGTITWQSVRPGTRPRIDARLLSHDRDIALAQETASIMMDLAHTEPLRSLWRGHAWPIRPMLSRRDRLGHAMRWSCDSGYHPCGTVPMGAEADPAAAASGQGQVFGVQGVWVGDASLMPTIPTGNTHLPTLMVASRVGEWLA